MEVLQPLSILHFVMFVLYFSLSVSCMRSPFTTARMAVSATMFSIGVWSLAKVIMHNSVTPLVLATAAMNYAFYFHLLAFSLMLYISILVRSNGKYFNSPLIILGIFILIIPFTVFALKAELYSLVKVPYGWATATNPSLLTFYNLTVIGQMILSIIIMLTGVFSKERRIRIIGIMMMFCLAIPMSAYFLLPPENIIANSADLQTFLVYLAFYLAITRFGLFDITESISINSIINNMRELLIMTDTEGNILQHNPAFKRSFPDLKNIAGAFSDSAEFSSLLRQAAQNSHSITGSMSIKTNDKNFTYAAVSVTTLRKFGNPVSFLWVLSDISDRRALEEHLKQYNETLEAEVAARTAELMQANLDLKKANDDLEHFSYASYHDMKEPLRQISLHLQLIKKSGNFPPGSDEEASFNYVISGTQRLNELINAIRSYIELKKPADNASFDLNESLKDALVTLMPEISIKKAEIHTSRLPRVRGSRALYASVFTNLIGNAIKYCDKTPEISVEYENNTVIIKDNGLGIKPEYLEKVFGLFIRLHTHDKYPGSGIGLAIVKKIVELHGGKIYAESDGVNGSTFKFTVRTV